MWSVVLLLLCNTVCFSQKVGFEMYGGLSNSSLRGNAFGGEFVGRYSGHLGSMLTIPISDYLGINLGLCYTPRGAVLNTNYYPFPIFKLYYLEFPVLLSAGSKNVHIYFGPQFSALLKSDIDGLDENDLGLKYGLGIDTNGRFIMRLFGYSGLTNVLPVNDYGLKNGYLQIAAGIKLVKSTYVAGDTKTFNVPHRTID